MTRFSIRGLRGRLLLALVVTSALTLGVVAFVTLSPLRERLRQQSATNLRSAVLDSVPELARAMGRNDRGKQVVALVGPAHRLDTQTDARVQVTDADPFHPLYPFESTSVDTQALLANLESWRTQTTVQRFDGDDLTIATPLYNKSGEAGVVVVQRRLTEVTAAVGQVRNALLAAAGGALLVAVALGIALSSTLTRRLARLRRTALRIIAEGPAAPAPQDSARDEVGDLARTLARMQEELRRQESARRAFVATASHELRTPLTMLQGTMELLEEDLRDAADLPDAQEQVASARRELRRLSALAGELLDLSRLDAAVQLRSEPVELGEVARAVAAEFELRASERAVRIDVVRPPEPCWGRGDPDAIARVVRILIDNGLRYGPPGEPLLVEIAGDRHEASIEVADSGPGIAPDERDTIFERFHRGRASSPESGFGLGLAIGRELAERMGGGLRLAEPDGRGPTGARFVLSVQAARRLMPDPRTPADAPRRAGSPSAGSRRAPPLASPADDAQHADGRHRTHG